MPMLVIEGTYKITGSNPDGDSVRFYPTDPQHWNLMDGQHRVRRNRSGGVQLRLDGIDALETHYTLAARSFASHRRTPTQPPLIWSTGWASRR